MIRVDIHFTWRADFANAVVFLCEEEEVFQTENRVL
jgi:hypothetical protein